MNPLDVILYVTLALVVLVLTFDARRRYDQPAGRRGPRRWWRND